MDREPASDKSFIRCPECLRALPHHTPQCFIYQETRRKLLKLGIIASAGAVAAFLLGRAQAVPAPSVSSIITPGSMEETASYVIYIDGSTYLAKNGRTGDNDYSGPDAATVIQSAINALPNGGNICLKGGLYSINSPITISSGPIQIYGLGGYIAPLSNFTTPPSNLPVLQANFTNHIGGIFQAGPNLIDSCSFDNLVFDMKGFDANAIYWGGGGNTNPSLTVPEINCSNLMFYNVITNGGNVNYAILIGAGWWNPIIYNCNFGNTTGGGGSIFFANPNSFIYVEQCQDYTVKGINLNVFNAILRDSIHQSITFGGVNNNNTQLIIVGGSFTNGVAPSAITLGTSNIPLIVLRDCFIWFPSGSAVTTFLKTSGVTLGILDIEGCVIQLSKNATWVDTAANVKYTTGRANVIQLGGNTLTNSPFYVTPIVVQTFNLASVNPPGFATTTPAVPATGVAQQNTNPYPIRIYFLTSGTVTSIVITDPAGTAQTITTAISALDTELILEAGASITLNYTGAPTWKWYGTYA